MNQLDRLSTKIAKLEAEIVKNNKTLTKEDILEFETKDFTVPCSLSYLPSAHIWKRVGRCYECRNYPGQGLIKILVDEKIYLSMKLPPIPWKPMLESLILAQNFMLSGHDIDGIYYTWHPHQIRSVNWARVHDITVHSGLFG